MGDFIFVSIVCVATSDGEPQGVVLQLRPATPAEPQAEKDAAA